MKIIGSLVNGPFKSEQEFKQAVLKVWKRNAGRFRYTHFEIENEEKEAGMPDALSISADAPAYFTEFKYADKNGVIEFKKSQPLFYRQHGGLHIQILVWDSRYDRVVHIDPVEVIAKKSLRITLPEQIGLIDAYRPEDEG
jgi:hypothetical protein